MAAKPVKPLSLPEGVASVSTEEMYRVPAVNSLDEFGDPVDISDYEVPRPQPMADKGEVGVKIQKLAGKRWIFLNASTAQVWPRTQYFLSQFDFSVAVSNASAGVIETDWLQFKDNKDLGVRFRIQLEKGIHPETTEIHITQMSRPQSLLRKGVDVNAPWPDTSDDPEREAWLLEELANNLADTVDNNAASLLGQNVGGAIKASFSRVDNEPTLHIRLPNERSWATINHAADKEGFKVWEANADQGVIYVGYTPYDEDGPGFFSHLIFWGESRELPEKAPYSLAEVLANLGTSDKVKVRFAGIKGAQFNSKKLEDKKGYLIVVIRKQDESLVNIRDIHGERLSDRVTKDFLRLLRKNLI